MADVTVNINDNGPYEILGPIQLRDADGNEFPLKGTSTCAAAAIPGPSRFATGPTGAPDFRTKHGLNNPASVGAVLNDGSGSKLRAIRRVDKLRNRGWRPAAQQVTR